MKKILNLILAILSFLLITGLVLFEINLIHPFITMSTQNLITIRMILSYGTMAVLSAWVLVYFLGAGVLRILLTILTILVIALGVIVFGFPEVVVNILG